MSLPPLPERKYVRLRTVTFSFLILDYPSLGLGNELIDLIHMFRKRFDAELGVLKLPRVVRIAFWDENPIEPNSLATFSRMFSVLSTPFDICINTNNLHELELQGSSDEDEQLFKFRMLKIFLHELTHFSTLDEEEANSIASEALKRMFNTSRQHRSGTSRPSLIDRSSRILCRWLRLDVLRQNCLHLCPIFRKECFDHERSHVVMLLNNFDLGSSK